MSIQTGYTYRAINISHTMKLVFPARIGPSISITSPWLSGPFFWIAYMKEITFMVLLWAVSVVLSNNKANALSESLLCNKNSCIHSCLSVFHPGKIASFILGFLIIKSLYNLSVSQSDIVKAVLSVRKSSIFSDFRYFLSCCPSSPANALCIFIGSDPPSIILHLFLPVLSIPLPLLFHFLSPLYFRHHSYYT